MTPVPLALDLRRPLGSGELRVSPMAWGMWRFAGDDLPAARARVEAALAAGINFFDTADIYGPDNGEAFGAAEVLLGKVLAQTPALRGQMVLASKAGIQIGSPYNSSAAYLITACEASLRRLGVERLDLFQIHRPDSLTHPMEVAGALDNLRRAGKIAEAGVSNHTPAQVAALGAHLPFALAAIQPELSALAIQPISDGTLDQAQQIGLTVMAWSPLAQGRLAGPPSQPTTAAVVTALDQVASRLGVSRTIVAYAWIMAHPSRPIPIIGSQRPDRIAEAVAAVSLSLSRSDWYAILTAARGEPLP